jgi:hypothetical protein
MSGILLAIISRQAILWGALSIFGFIGLIAVVSPNRFAVLATRSGRWVDTNKVLEVLDKRIDIDRYVLPFSRLLGITVILAVAVLAYVIYCYA